MGNSRAGKLRFQFNSNSAQN